jgi:hypothetical protein
VQVGGPLFGEEDPDGGLFGRAGGGGGGEGFSYSGGGGPVDSAGDGGGGFMDAVREEGFAERPAREASPALPLPHSQT